MKHILSISLGSSKRDHKVEIEIKGENFLIERLGTDGDYKRAVSLIKEYDGKAAAFGMGGIDLYVIAGSRRYTLRDAVPLAQAAKITPIVDGSGLKNTLERKVIYYLHNNGLIDFKDKKVLLVCGVDRFGMASSLEDVGAKVTYGDLMFALGLPFPIRSLKGLDMVARIVAPIACRLPFQLLYPTGKQQEKTPTPKYVKEYENADIIAGDFHFIKKHLPSRLDNKIIITNTVTSSDVELLRSREVKTLITTTPNIKGRSFGTNVMEGLLVALAGKPSKDITPEDYSQLLDEIGFKPSIENLNFKAVS